jgi:hypothetical protein
MTLPEGANDLPLPARPRLASVLAIGSWAPGFWRKGEEGEAARRDKQLFIRGRCE